jgi:hypothetical protein
LALLHALTLQAGQAQPQRFMGKLRFPQDLLEFPVFTIPQDCKVLRIKQAQIEPE